MEKSMLAQIRTVVFLLFVLASGSVAAQEHWSIPLQMAKQYFREADDLCKADDGRLWGVSLCGPMLFVDPETRTIVANQADSAGMLKKDGDVFRGVLPKDQNMANTAVQWAGVHWTEIVWPLPEDAKKRRALMAHELYHRIQDQVTNASGGQAQNSHLDELEGRYLLRLEWNALQKALNATSTDERRKVTRDALLFRAERYSKYPQAEAQETSLEMNEGFAEYTGVFLANSSRAERVNAAIADIAAHSKDPTYVRSFAYATGPAYGLLLDEERPQWKKGIRAGKTLYSSTREAVGFEAPVNLAAEVKLRAKLYGGDEIRVAEEERERHRQALVAEYRSKFVEGATLTLPFKHMQVQFDPRNLQPLGDAGTVYPSIRITDDWGVLEANNGALLKPDWSAVVITAPSDTGGPQLQGSGWSLELKPGWKLVAGGRKGDYSVAAVN